MTTKDSIDRGEAEESKYEYIQKHFVNVSRSAGSLRGHDPSTETKGNTPESRAGDQHSRPSRVAAVCLSVHYNKVIVSLQEKLSELEKLGWRHFSSSLYFISTETKSWEESRPGDHKYWQMTTLSTGYSSRGEPEFSAFIHEFIDKGFWIGLTDRDEEGTWQRVDGTPLTTEKDCVERRTFISAPEESWHNTQCSEMHLWICEKVAYE
uniref:C-type lectin domain-containing protein n=1 Tax=Salmo trutta TaxID=8032 RepID=A0A673Z2V5_SALTR